MVFPYFFRFVRVPVVVIVAVAVVVVVVVVVVVAVAVVVVVVAVVVYLVVLGGTRSCRSRSEGGSPQVREVRSLKKEVSEKITTGITGLWRPSVHSTVAF